MSIVRVLVLCVFAFCFSTASHGQHRQHGTHVHGEGELLLVLEDQTLDMSFRIPAGDLIGFEHAATTKEEEESIANAKAFLRNADQVFTLTGSPECELRRSSALFALTTHDHGEEESSEEGTDNTETDQSGPSQSQPDQSQPDHGDDHSQHAEFHVRHKYQCSQPTELETIVFNLFETYAAIEKVKAALIIFSEQSAATLTAEQPEIRIKACRISIGGWCLP